MRPADAGAGGDDPGIGFDARGPADSVPAWSGDVSVRRARGEASVSRHADAERCGVLAGSTADLMEQNRISPRSPRAALEPERVPAPTRRSSGARHPLVVAGNAVFTILILIAIVGGGILLVGKQRFDARGPLAEDKVVSIPKGLGMRDIADLLAREGVIDQPWVFVGGAIAAKMRGYEFKAGEYQFPRQASLEEAISTIVSGKVVQHQISIPEGLTSDQI